MKLSKRSRGESSPEPTGNVADQPGKLAGVQPLRHDEDERPSREDRDYGSTIFTKPPVPLPRFLGGKKHRPSDK
jgi:hypothetical protein